ncbi:MAG: pyruvate kinase [Oscillospiraceae bacterium]|nr:pyruvate kinase [Oscillospiraceae bacterium]
MRKTKIICTLGPASDNEEVLLDMIRAGMNVARFNFSHGSHEEQKMKMDMVRKARKKLGKPVALLLDTKGPEIRTGVYKDGRIEIKEGQTFTLTTREIEGDDTQVSINYKGLPQDVSVGTKILIDDGLVAFEVVSLTDTDIVCKALNDGPLSNRKSVNVPGIKLNMEYISPKDREDLIFGCKEKVDYVAASFCRNAQDMRDLRAVLNENGGDNIAIIAKIENMEGVENIEEILDEVEGIMVARGDLGVEVDFELLPMIQKSLIKKCIHRGKIVVTATQMLDSMTKNPRPTRAEVSDVANAVFDGTGAIMLSGETGVGKYPVETVRTMSKIAENAEHTMRYHSSGEYEDIALEGDCITNAIAHAVCATSEDLDAKCIVAFTDSGFTANAVSCRKPEKTIVGATPDPVSFHKMALFWGVQPCLVKRPKSGTDLYLQAVRAAVETVDAQMEDIIVITAGMPVGRTPYTNTMRVMHITQDFIDLAFEDEF